VGVESDVVLLGEFLEVLRGREEGSGIQPPQVESCS
jgi:hypothetical protein